MDGFTNSHHVPNASESIPLPPEDQIRTAARSSDQSAADRTAIGFAEASYAPHEIEAKANIASAQRRLALKETQLKIATRELERIPAYQDMLAQSPERGFRQPGAQILYNFLRVIIGLLGPVVGGAYLVTLMQDTSYAMAQTPELAYLTAGMILLGSTGATTWATSDITDQKKTDKRVNFLAVCGLLSFTGWAVFMALRFALPPSSLEDLTTSFDPTGSASPFAFVNELLEWVQTKAAGFISLGLHLFGDAMISGAIVGSAISGMRKSRLIKTVHTDKYLLASEKIQSLEVEIYEVANELERAKAHLNAVNSKKNAARDLVKQKITHSREKHQAKKDKTQAESKLADLED